MKATWIALLSLIAFVFAAAALAQESNEPGVTEAIAPRLIKFSGVLKAAARGQALITFSLYDSREGWVSLWRESQLITPDDEGRYTVFLGALEDKGLPLELFTTGKAQWLGIQVESEDEQARVLLVAVPYALKAADADTLGGKTTSSFALNEDLIAAGGDLNAYTAILQQRAGNAGSGKPDENENATERGKDRIVLQPILDRNSRTALYTAQLTNLTSFGESAGTTGESTSFFGAYAGRHNTGNMNSFFGQNAGYANNIGGNNTFVGTNAGYSNTTGSYNSMVGMESGFYNTLANNNSFFGYRAGYFNTGGFNSFFGDKAGYSNTGGSNSFFGSSAGYNNTTGFANSFIGAFTGSTNTAGALNSFVGTFAGFSNTTGNANSFFGSSAGSSNNTGVGNSFFGYYTGLENTIGSGNSFFGHAAGQKNATGSFNSFVGQSAGIFNVSGAYNSFVGYGAGISSTIENYNSFLGALSDGATGITNATAIGYRAKVTGNNSLVLGGIAGINSASVDTNVGIGTT